MVCLDAAEQKTMRKNWRIVLGGIVIVPIGPGMFVGQRANYVAAQNHTAVDDAGILYTFFKTVGYCPDSPESAVFQLARYGFESRTDDLWGEKYQYHCSTGLIEKVCSFGTDQSLGGNDDI